MATLTAALRTHLLADAAIAVLVGPRVRPRKLAQGETMPAVRVTRIGGTAHEHLGGASSLGQATVQLDAYASTAEGADQLAELIRLRILAASRQTLSGTFVSAVQPQGDLRQIEEPRGDGGDSYDFVSSRDYLVSYQQ